jgi:hypothetical protein
VALRLGWPAELVGVAQPAIAPPFRDLDDALGLSGLCNFNAVVPQHYHAVLL